VLLNPAVLVVSGLSDVLGAIRRILLSYLLRMHDRLRSLGQGQVHVGPITWEVLPQLQCVDSSCRVSRRQKAHRTVNSTCSVHHRTVRWSQLLELQRSNPNGWVTWLAHRTVSGGAPDCPVAHQTVRCAHRQTSSPTTILVVEAINIPQPPHFKASKFSAIAFNTRALDFTPRHKQEIKSSPKSGITPNN
jgi:hypothetical protein